MTHRQTAEATIQHTKEPGGLLHYLGTLGLHLDTSSSTTPLPNTIAARDTAPQPRLNELNKTAGGAAHYCTALHCTYTVVG